MLKWIKLSYANTRPRTLNQIEIGGKPFEFQQVKLETPCLLKEY